MLSLYRRHSRTCRVHGMGLDAKTVRAFLDCNCPLWITGHTARIAVPRQSLETNDLSVAEAKRRALLADSNEIEAQGLRLRECVADYIASREHELDGKTKGQYGQVLGDLVKYAEAQKRYHVEQLTVDLVERAVAKMPGSINTKSTKQAKVRAFLKDAYRREWIKQDIASRIKPITASYEEPVPYTEEEVERLLEAAEKINGGRNGYASQPKTFRLLLELMLETGLRVSDAVAFDPSRLERGGQLWVYTYSPEKAKRRTRRVFHEVFITDKLKERIMSSAWLSSSLPFKFGPEKRNPAHWGNEVYERMRNIGARNEIADCRPHRLRDTFAVRALLRGASLDDVSRLLGHSSVKVTETHYAPWVAGRKRRLESIAATLLHP